MELGECLTYARHCVCEQNKLIPDTKTLRSLEQEKDTYDDYTGKTLSYKDKLKQMASEVSSSPVCELALSL